jgi:HK97 family phage portal protein
MNFFDRVFKRSYSNLPTFYWREIINGVYTYDDDYSIYNNAAADTCSTLIANTIASIPLNILIKSDVKKTTLIQKDDPRYDLLHYYPNDYQSAFSFWHLMEYTKQMEGNSFARIIRPKGKQIVLEFIHPKLLYQKGYEIKNGILNYKFVNGEKIVNIPSSEIIHFKLKSRDGYIGEKPEVALSKYLQLSYMAIKTITTYYVKGGKGRDFIKTQIEGVDTKKIKEKIADFRKEAAGYWVDEKGNKHSFDLDKVVPFPELPGFSEVQHLPDDQNADLFNAVMEYCNLQMGAFYQIPGHYLNILKAEKNNNVETRQLDFKSATIDHQLRQNRQELEMKLLTSLERKSGYSIEYNTMSIVELDHETRMKGYESLQRTAGMTWNEVRLLENMELRPDGDNPFIFNQMTTPDQINNDAPEK